MSFQNKTFLLTILSMFFLLISCSNRNESLEELETKLEEFETKIEELNFEGKIYPILKSKNWEGLKTGVLNDPFISGNDNADIVVAYGYDGPDDFLFLTNDDLENTTLEEIKKEAKDNIKAIYGEDDITIKDGMGFFSTKKFCSEKILDSEFLIRAQELLKTDEILVSIPRRTVMFIIAKDAPEEKLQEFYMVHQYTVKDSSYGNAPISKLVWIAKNGKIIGGLQVDE